MGGVWSEYRNGLPELEAQSVPYGKEDCRIRSLYVISGSSRHQHDTKPL